MNVINLYMTCEEFSNIIKTKLSKEDQENFQDCTWIPLKIGLNETNMCIETFVVPVKDKINNKLTREEYIEKYCKNCGSFCSGVDSEYFDGCVYSKELEQ